MATFTLLSLDLHEIPKSQRQVILDQVKHGEKKIFPRTEAFDFDMELKKRNTELIVVVDDSSSFPILVAYAVYAHAQKMNMLHKVCVLEKFRRQGIARKLLLFQHQRLRFRGRPNVQLWVDEERLPARQLYLSIGFVKGGATDHEMALLVSLLFLAGRVVAAPDIALPINSQVPPVARINQPFNFTFSASTFASSTGILDYVVTDTPAWLQLDASSRTLSGTPASDAAGSFQFHLAAMDRTGSTVMPVTMVVATDAGPSLGTPVEEQLSSHDGFQSPDTIFVPHSSALAVSFSSDTFVNTNHDTVYYAMCANNTPLPSWITFDAGTLSFSGMAPQTTSADELPQTFSLQFTASDVEGFSAAVASFRVTVENHVLMFDSGYYAVSTTPGLAFEYDGLQGALKLNGAPVDHAIIRQVQVDTPSWMSFDKNTWVLSGNPPLSAKSESISVTAVDVYGEVAVTSVLLQVETNTTADLFSGIPDRIYATTGMDLKYTFNSSVITTPDANISVDLGLAASWLRFDNVTQELSGRVPKDLLPQDIVLNVTVSQGSRSQSEPLTIRIQDSAHSANGRSTGAPDPTADSSPAVPSTTSAPSSSKGTKSRSSRNKSRTAAAIAVPVVVACLLLILGCCLFAKRRRRRTETKWPSEHKQKISRPFLSDKTGLEEDAGPFIQKPVPAVEKPSRAPFIDLPGFRTSMASKRRSFFRLSKGTTDEAVQAPNVDSWDLYTQELSIGKPKEAEQRRFSLVPEEGASSARGKRRTSSNKQAFRGSKPLGITNISPKNRNAQNRRRSDMSFTSTGLLANQRISGFGHGRNRSSLITSSNHGRVPRGVGHGNGGLSLGGHVVKSWRASKSWSTINTSEASSQKYSSGNRLENAVRRSSSQSSSMSSPTRRNPTKPRPSPRKRGSDTLSNDREIGLGTLISNALSQRLHSGSKSSAASSSRRFGSARASTEYGNQSPELGLEEVRDEDGSRRWKYPDVHPNPLGLHTPSATPPTGSPEMTGEEQSEEEYSMARHRSLAPIEKVTERTGGGLQRFSYLRQQGIGGRYGADENGEGRVMMGGSRGKRPISVDKGPVARGASMRGDLVGGLDEETHEIAFV
ncbi:MAG: hypothetical protein Q9168_001145 [Polycauliona sp. 1 TL-2023]